MANNDSGNINASEDIQVENLRRCLKMKKQSKDQLDKRVYRIVLTGGPSGGKTTGQSRLSTFFENLGWKVFRVPETATVLLSGGIKFSDLTEKEIYKFQENLVRTMMQIENTYFQLGKSSTRNCLIICDRGFMDASAYISKDKWEKMMMTNNWHAIEMRDNRYNQVIHLVSAAHGAEEFYSIAGHASRSEDVDLARQLDNKCAEAWVGHPYFDVIDNSTNFETKMNRLIETVCQTVGIHIADRFLPTSRKLLFLVANIPGDGEFPPFQDFEVEHRYLQSSAPHVQVRLRKRGQNNRWSYEQTIIYNPNGHDASRIEVKAQLTKKIYLKLLAQRDKSHAAIYQKRRCFLLNNQYFQLDIFKETNSNPRCKGLILLETYSSQSGEVLLNCLPKFLSIVKEVTGDPDYCMFNLSLK